jgi:hypothetical protein
MRIRRIFEPMFIVESSALVGQWGGKRSSGTHEAAKMFNGGFDDDLQWFLDGGSKKIASSKRSCLRQDIAMLAAGAASGTSDRAAACESIEILWPVTDTSQRACSSNEIRRMSLLFHSFGLKSEVGQTDHHDGASSGENGTRYF